MHVFHKWVFYDRYKQDVYLDQPWIKTFSAFRICNICGKVQEYITTIEGDCWNTLDLQQRQIFIDIIEDEEKMSQHSLQERE